MTMRLFLIMVVLLCGCGRKLTENEMAFIGTLQGGGMNLDRVRIVEGAPVGSITFRRQPRPRVTCRELILPPVREEIVTAKPAAVALFTKVYFVRDWYVPDYMQSYPEAINLGAAMLLAHEITHVWQWQNRKRTGYSPLRAAAEHGNSSDPYLFDLNGAPDFLSYGFEQQGSIVEEYVCCRSLAPDAARTKRLHNMLKEAFPVADLPKNGHREHDVLLPWRGAELNGICA